MVGWHHQLNRHNSEQAPGDDEGQGSLACCSPWGLRVGHDWVTEQQSMCWYISGNYENGIHDLFLQSRNRDTDIQNKYMIWRDKEGWEELGQWYWHIYTIDIKYKIDK